MRKMLRNPEMAVLALNEAILFHITCPLTVNQQSLFWNGDLFPANKVNMFLVYLTLLFGLTQ